MYTLRLEITTTERVEFYNPAVDECKAFPRTEDGVKRALKKFEKWIVSKADWITGARVVLYEGMHESYKNMEPVTIATIY
jgi:hypothetical protein